MKLALPGHGSPFGDHRKRIDQLLAHHQGRSEAAYGALGNNGRDAYEVTLALDGLLSDRDPLDRLPLIRKFIHTRHTFAYLQHLAAQGRVRKEHRHGRILFFPCQPTDLDLGSRERRDRKDRWLFRSLKPRNSPETLATSNRITFRSAPRSSRPMASLCISVVPPSIVVRIAFL